jgi:enterochelin esterase-like enzyme
LVRCSPQLAVHSPQSTVSSSQLAVGSEQRAVGSPQLAATDSLPVSTPQTVNPKLQTPNSKPQFWLQTGTEDEKDDRNHNGIIDSIEDTLDLIAELERKGFRWGRDIRYVEVKGGHHDQATWSAIMPDFLTWAFSNK